MTETLFGVLMSISNELVKEGVNSIWPKTKKLKKRRRLIQVDVTGYPT